MYSYLIRNYQTKENLTIIVSDYDVDDTPNLFWDSLGDNYNYLFYYPQLWAEKISYSSLDDLISFSSK